MRGQRTRYGAAIAAMAASTILLYTSPLVIRSAIDGVLLDKAADTPTFINLILGSLGIRPTLGRSLAVASTAVVLATALSGALAYARGRWVALASEALIRNLRNNLYRHLQHLPATYHDTAQTGDLVQRCTSDVETLRLFYNNQVIEIARAVLLLVTVMPILIVLDWRMSLLAVSLLPVIVLFSVVFFGRVQRQFKATDEAEGAMTTVLQEHLTGIRVVRAFARQEYEVARFDQKNHGHRQLHYRLFRTMATFWATSDLLCFTQTAVVLFAGAWRVAHGSMTVGTLVAFLTYAQMYIWPVRQMGRVLTELGKAMVSLQRVQEILQVPKEAPPAAPQRDIPPRVRGHIAIRNLSFSHASRLVLSDITLDVPAGQTLALLGPSGSGKSTLVNLLLRLYDYAEGSITLDGLELNDLDRKFVRSQFGVVMQEPFLYSKTLRENLKLGRHDSPDPEMLEASRIAAIHDSIEGFDKRYDTVVGERGVTLSGGQRQRVAIARAILRDAPILVLDDALSAVDTQTETAILNALRHRRGRHTTLLIAHRLSTLAQADQIAVLDHGRVVQLGTHDQLITQDGLYRRLWQIQSALEEDLFRELTQPFPDSRPPAVVKD